MFIDRINEMETLEKEYSRKGSSFVVIYGRRRLGKTTLISEFCKDKKSVSFLATEESESDNMASFKSVIAETFGDPLLQNVEVSDWDILFDYIKDRADKKEKIVISIDEFQFLGKSNPAFPSILMKIWDKKLKSENIMLILCGSLIRMMTSQVLSYDSPLYGRRTAQIKMKQIEFKYYSGFNSGIPYNDQILRYAVTGGVPKYIELFNGEGTIYDLIEENVMNTGSFLYEEPDFLLRSEVREVGRYYTILKNIASGKRKVSEISAASGMSQTDAGSYLKTLTDLDIIEREVPVTEYNPEKSRMGQYKIIDNYIHFWFRFIYPYRNLIESGQSKWVIDRIKKPFIENHVSYVYEEICRKRVLDEFGVNCGLTRIGRWWDNKNAEIDIMGMNEDNEVILLGECKYSSKKKGMSELNDLMKKAEYIKKGGVNPEYYVICCLSGFDDRLTEYAKANDNIILIS